jgi:hypothetical protein
MRVTLVPAALISLAILGISWLNWTSAPMAGPAWYRSDYESEATRALVRDASQHAVSLASPIILIAMALVVVAMVLLTVWPRTFGFLMVAAITPAALVVAWITTRSDLATIAHPS